MGLSEEVELCEMRDRLALDGTLEREVEVIERLDLRKARSLDAGIRSSDLALVGLLRQDRGEERFVVPALSACSLREQLRCLGDARHLERAGEKGDLGGDRTHDVAPTRAS